jgi:uncharacterized protein YbjT (DUF2867 family)
VRALVTGASGYIGGLLASALARDGFETRCLVRSEASAERLRREGLDVHVGDVLDRASLRGAGEGVDVAYYLVHAMGRGSAISDFGERERRAAQNFAAMASAEGVPRIVYLGGLGDAPGSEHLRSRHETARILAAANSELTYFRAAMVVGAGSESFRTLRYLVARLPVMVAPGWLRTPTQPIAIDDVIAYLRAAPQIQTSAGREVQIGGPDVLSYGDMLGEMARELGLRPRPMLPVPLLTPFLSSLWIGLITPVDAGVARPLVEGLSTRTIVTDPTGAALFGVEPVPFREALRRALAEERAEGRRYATFELLRSPEHGVPRTDAVSSSLEARLSLPAAELEGLWRRENLERLARAYWHHLRRVSLGLIRVVYGQDSRSVVLVSSRLRLLRFHAPEYQGGSRRASVTWPIERGLLVARRGRDKGWLRIVITRVSHLPGGDPAERESVHVRVEVRNFYPWLRGGRRFGRLGAWLYSQTQLRIHRRITAGFLRSIARLDLPAA